jgi:hypothetical protein
MKILISTIFSLIIANCSYSQTYISLNPALTNDIGTIAEKSNLSFEIGRQWDVFSLGLDLGKTSLGNMHGNDTSTYLEIRPNLNVFQQGKFTNTFTAGIGYIFNSQQSLMTEVTSGIEYTLNSKVHFNIYFGQYYYSGKYAASSVTFFGLSGMFYFLPSHAKGILNGKSSQTP